MNFRTEAEVSQVLRLGLERNPASVELAVALAESMRRAGNLEEARNLLDSARTREPGAAAVYVALAGVAFAQESIGEASSYISRALERLVPDRIRISSSSLAPGCSDSPTAGGAPRPSLSPRRDQPTITRHISSLP